MLAQNKSKLIITDLIDTPFKDDYFDYSFLIFDDIKLNINNLIKEIERINKNKIYILYNKNTKHLKFTDNYKELILLLLYKLSIFKE